MIDRDGVVLEMLLVGECTTELSTVALDLEHHSAMIDGDADPTRVGRVVGVVDRKGNTVAISRGMVIAGAMCDSNFCQSKLRGLDPASESRPPA